LGIEGGDIPLGPRVAVHVPDTGDRSDLYPARYQQRGTKPDDKHSRNRQGRPTRKVNMAA